MSGLDLPVIGVVGAGTMGRGIAQLFVQSGRTVLLHDADPEAVRAAQGFIAQMLRRRAEKGEMGADAAEAALGRLQPAASLSAMAGAALVIEAIAERLEVKQALFAALEAVLSDSAVLATNTSSLLVTAIAASCRRPQRVVGLHFFNPVPLMRLVEVIRGERTDPAVVERMCALTRAAGHQPVVSADMPGFIVNHAGRALYTEGLQLMQEGVAGPAEIDTIIRDLAGLRMGPFELFDLTGIDVSGAVVESVAAQYAYDPRYRPSPIIRRRVAAGLFGRKTGEGFYRYEGQTIQRAPEPDIAPAAMPASVFVHAAADHPELVALVKRLGGRLDPGPVPHPDSLVVLAPLGEDCASLCARHGYPAERCVGIDGFFGFAGGRRALSVPVSAGAATIATARWFFSRDGARVTVSNDSVALVAQRVMAVIVNLGCEIAQQRIASPDDLDRAVRIGLGYPDGPLGLGDRYGPGRVLTVIEGLQRLTGDPRYRPSAWLGRRARLGLSLKVPDPI